MANESIEGYPPAGASVEVHEPDGKSSLGRVQSADAGGFVVAISATSALGHTHETGSDFALQWPARGGVMNQPVRLVHRHGASQLELWEFTATGTADFEQRRHQVRLVESGEIRLTVFPQTGPRPISEVDGPGAQLAGSLIDLSELALQCVVATGAGDAVVSSGALVACEFTAGGEHFSLRGTVHTAWSVDRPPRVRVVVRFEAGQEGQDALARYVRRAAADRDEP